MTGEQNYLNVSVKNESLYISSNYGKFIYDHQFDIEKEYNIIIEQTGKIKIFLNKYAMYNLTIAHYTFGVHSKLILL